MLQTNKYIKIRNEILIQAWQVINKSQVIFQCIKAWEAKVPRGVEFKFPCEFRRVILSQWNHQAPFCGFLIFLVKKGKWIKLYVWIHTIARSKEHVPMSSEWYLDIFNSTYFDVFMNFVDQKVFKKTIINQKHDFHGQFLVVIRIWSICYVVERSRCLVRAYLQNTITIGVEFEHCEQLAKSIQIDQI